MVPNRLILKMSTTVFIVRVFSCEINLTVSRSGENSRSVGSLLLSINFTPDQSGLFWSEQFYSRSVEAFLIGEYILRAALNFLIETFFRASTIKNKTPSTQEDPCSDMDSSEIRLDQFSRLNRPITTFNIVSRQDSFIHKNR